MDAIKRKRPEAGTHRASSQLSRFTGDDSVKIAYSQARSREQIDAAKQRVGISAAWHALGLPGKPRRITCSPFREDRHPSFSITGDQLWHDHATGEGGDVVSFVRRATGCNDREAICRVIELAGGSLASPVTLAPRVAAPACTRPAYDGLSSLTLEAPTLAELIALAELRAWPTFSGLEIAASRGLLRMANVTHRGESHRAWLLTDAARRSAQARRLDGQNWAGEGGHTYKSKTLRSDAEHPPGLADVLTANRPAVLLCEGEPDTLAALTFAWLAGESARVGVVALTGASKDIPPAVIGKLSGRRCRIFRQTDTAGHVAALRWAESLAGAGIACDFANLDGLARADGQPAKDAADLLRRPSDLENLEPIAAALLAGLTE